MHFQKLSSPIIRRCDISQGGDLKLSKGVNIEFSVDIDSRIAVAIPISIPSVIDIGEAARDCGRHVAHAAGIGETGRQAGHSSRGESGCGGLKAKISFNSDSTLPTRHFEENLDADALEQETSSIFSTLSIVCRSNTLFSGEPDDTSL